MDDSDSSSEDLLRAEEIYDLDTAALRDKLAEVMNQMGREADFERKHKLANIGEIIALEIEERALAVDFEENCEKILGSLDAVVENVDLMIERNRKLFSEPQTGDMEASNSPSIHPKPKNRVKLPPIDPDRLMSPSTQFEIINNSSHLSHSTSHSRAITSTQCSDYRLPDHYDAVDESHHQSRLYPRNKAGKAGWLDFVKNTLNTTKVQNQVLSVGQGVFKKPPRSTNDEAARSSRSRDRADRKPPVDGRMLQMEMKRKMREATKAYAESTRKRNQLEARHKSGQVTDTIEVQPLGLQAAGLVRDVPVQSRTANKPPSVSSFLSADEGKQLAKKSKTIRVSSNSSLPYPAGLATASMPKKRENTKDAKLYQPLASIKKQKMGARDLVSPAAKNVKQREIENVVMPLEPEFEHGVPILEPYSMSKSEDHLYIAQVYDKQPLEAVEHLTCTIENQHIKKAVGLSRQKSAKIGEPRNRVDALATAEKVFSNQTSKQHYKRGPSSHRSELKTLTPKEKLDKVGVKGSPKGPTARADPEKAQKKGLPTPNPKQGAKSTTRERPKETMVKKIEKPSVETDIVDLQSEATQTAKTETQERSSVVSQISRTVKKSSRKDEVVGEENREVEEKRMKINNQIEVWKATKTVSAQMRSTSDLRALLPEPLDYSDVIPTWAHLFSETYIQKANQEPDILSAMRDVTVSKRRSTLRFCASTTS